jgi:sugar/nucleoside kinase (ribokinase family)
MKVAKRFDVALFGSVFVDHVLTGFDRWLEPGEEGLARNYIREAGGGCFNTACGLARLGNSTACFAIVGASDSQELLDRVRTLGISTEFVRTSSLPTAVTVAISVGNERSFYTYYGANAELTIWLEQAELASQLALARHVHFALPLPVDVGICLTRELHSAGCTVSLDVGDDQAWLSDTRVWDLLREIDWFLPNQREAAALTGESESCAIIQAFRERGVSGAVIKLGVDGAAMWAPAAESDRLIKAPALVVDAVDTTGAGDAFNAGFLYACLAGMPPEECLRWGVTCGSLSVREMGSIAGFPTVKEILEHHENYVKR